MSILKCPSRALYVTRAQLEGKTLLGCSIDVRLLNVYSSSSYGFGYVYAMLVYPMLELTAAEVLKLAGASGEMPYSHRRELTAFSVAFSPVNENSGDQLPLHHPTTLFITHFPSIIPFYPPSDVLFVPVTLLRAPDDISLQEYPLSTNHLDTCEYRNIADIDAGVSQSRAAGGRARSGSSTFRVSGHDIADLSPQLVPRPRRGRRGPSSVAVI
ncbi:hypothetical protein EVAR_29439_1 [Eumeta japonica]|uniref:Uncharacterized protein n=1 Tax=Eumeta variegata TaxID=151549 RepID=A0A4C1VW10_EUMVA|nr:hypothetical protein EVAR_29439_1 [Eumeta japonica]